MQLDKKTRDHLSKAFNIQQSSVCEVRNETVVSDGKTNEDLLVITSETMAKYVGKMGSGLTFNELWSETLKQAALEMDPNYVVVKDKYCDTCASTKGRHFKGCPKFK